MVDAGEPAQVDDLHADLLALELGQGLVLGAFLGAIGFGRVGQWLRWMDKKEMRRQTADGFTRLGLTLPAPTTKVTALSGGQRQAVAIARAVLWGSHIVVLDEPAAALGVKQTEIVLSFIEGLRAHGVACIFISHNMEHVMRVADRIGLMRLGEKIFDAPAATTSGPELVAMMTGATIARSA